MAAISLGASGSTVRVMFVDQSGDAIGGAERSLELLLANLSTRFDITVLLFGEGPFAQSMRDAHHNVEVLRLPQSIASVRRERVAFASVFPSVRSVFALKAIFAKTRPDVVYTNTIKAHVLAGVAARLAGRKCVIHFRDILDGRARAIVRAVARACSSERVAISDAVKRAYALDDTSVIPNPLDLSAYRSLPTKDESRRILGLPAAVPIVGLVGRINRWKGQDRFLRIAALVAQRSNAHFAIVGEAIFRDTEFVAELHDLARELCIADRVHFVPWLPDPRIAYCALDVNCNTSEREPFGRTIIEAAAAGVPTVCFDDGGSAEAVPPAQRRDFVVPFPDLEAFAAAILVYTTNSSLCAAAGAEARGHADLFDARVHAERVGALIDRVAGIEDATCRRS